MIMKTVQYLSLIFVIFIQWGKSNPIYGGTLEGKILTSNGYQHEVNSYGTPYMVYIDVTDLDDPRPVDQRLHTSCGGVILGSRIVLTAAHCIVGNARNPYITIVAGVQNLELVSKEKAQVTHGEKYILHINYQEECRVSRDKVEFCANDLALIRTKTAFEFKQSVKVAVLAGSRSSQKIEKGWIYGWGMTESNTISDHLRKAQMKITSLETCAKKYRSFVFRNTNWCLVSDNHKSAACPGDSGGPFVVNGVIYGIFAFSNIFQDKHGKIVGCDNYMPSVYINIIQYEKWIKQITKILFPSDFKNHLKFDGGSKSVNKPIIPPGKVQEKPKVKPSAKPPIRTTAKSNIVKGKDQRKNSKSKQNINQP